MKRPLLHMAIAFGAGILAAWHIRQAFFFMVVFLLLVLLVIYGVKKKLPFMQHLVLWGVCLFLGYLNYAFQATVMIKPLEPFYEAHVTVAGYVNSVCSVQDGRATFSFYVENCKTQEFDNPIRRSIRVTIYDAENSDDFFPGRRFTLVGILEKPKGSRNPGGFNFQSYLFSKKQPALMSAGMSKIKWGGLDKNLPLLRFGVKTRNAVLSSLEKNLSGEKAALMSAMLIGDRNKLTEPMEDAFSASGLAHIMAVSGANLAFLLLPVLWLFGMLGLNRRVSAICAIPVIFFYMLITGAEASIMRASVMAAIILAGKALDRKADLLNSLGIASLVLLLVNPFMLLDTGFLLSFGATAGLGLLYRRVLGVIPGSIPGFIRETLAATISAQLGVFPLLIRYFSKVSVVSLLSNLVVVPLTGMTTVIGMLCVIAGKICDWMGVFFGYILEGLLHIILYITNTCASVSWAEMNMRHWHFWLIGLYYVLLILAGAFGFSFFKRYQKYAVACIFLVGAVLLIQGLIPDGLKVTFIDIGQGDSALIQTPDGKNYLMDCGGSNNEAKTGYIGRQVIFPLLMHEGISSLDQVIVSHAHADHLSGLLTLLDFFPVKSVGLPQYPDASEDFSALIKICMEKDIPLIYYAKGDTLALDSKTTLDILYPDGMMLPPKGNLNNSSLCGLLQYNQLQLLFTGDLEKDAEQSFFELNLPFDCDILKTAHHGGKNATSEEFLQIITPEIAVISVGKNNFGHPSKDVLDRLQANGVKTYATINNGAVIVESNGMRYRVKRWYRDEWFTFFD